MNGFMLRRIKSFYVYTIKKTALELLCTKCNGNFMYSVSATSSALKSGSLKKKVLDNLGNIFDQ